MQPASTSRARGPQSAKHADCDVTSSTRTSGEPAAGQVGADPGEVVVAERGAGDDREALLLQPRDGEVALDPAAPVEHLRVGDLPDLARDAVVAQPLEELRRARPADLELGERGLVEQRRGLAAGAVLGADRRRPVHARPAARAQRLVARRLVGGVPVDALPAGLLAEHRAVALVPRVGGRHAQRPAGLALVARVLDVVVGLVDLARARRACSAASGSARRSAGCPCARGRATARPRRSTRPSPCRSPPAPASPWAQKPAATKKPRTAVSPRQNSPSGVNASGPLISRVTLTSSIAGHALARVDDDLLEAVPVVLEQPAVEVGRDVVEAAAAVASDHGAESRS